MGCRFDRHDEGSDAVTPQSKYTPHLHGRVAVISGATGDLGRVVAGALAAAGARLALLGTSEERLGSLVAELGGSRDHLTCVVDLTNAAGAPAAAAAVVERFGRVDVVVQLLGGWAGGQATTEVPDDAVADMLDRHLWSTFFLARAFVPHLTSNGWGRLIAISSPVVADPPARQLPYVVGKAAQEALVLTLAEELRGTGVTANLIVVRKIEAERPPAAEHKPGAPGTTPEEIVGAILYVCSDEARAVNGARLPLYRSR